MTYLGSVCFDGVALGALYGLVALAFVLIFKATGIINFAQGSIVLVAGYLVYDFEEGALHLPFLPALLLAVAAVAILSVFAQWVVLSRVIGQNAYTLLMITLGLDIFLRAASQARYGVEPLSIPTLLQGDWHMFGLTLGYERITAIAAGLLTAACFGLFFRHTRVGLAMRVTAADPEVAQALGIDVRRAFALAWAFAGLLSLIAAVLLISLPGYGLEPATADIALRAFPAAILGGMDSLGGAVVGGLIIGLVETLTAAYQPHLAPFLGTGLEGVTPYIVMILIMLVRPQGLFGNLLGERV